MNIHTTSFYTSSYKVIAILEHDTTAAKHSTAHSISTSTMAPKVLFVLTSHDAMGDSGNKTGWYLPEFAHPYNVLKDHAEITIASPNGGEAPLDQGSVEAFKEDAEATKFYKTKEALWKNTEKLSSFLGRAKEFDAIFYVGGHGRKQTSFY